MFHVRTSLLLATFWLCAPSPAQAQCLDLDLTGGYVSVPHDPALAPNTLTVEAWFVLDVATTQRYPTLARKNVNGTEAWSLRLSRIGGRYFPEFTLRTATGVHVLTVQATIQPGTPKHFAATYDGSEVRLYVDGASSGLHTVTGNLVDTGDFLAIGQGDLNNPAGEHFEGRIDALRLWNRARTQNEIASTRYVELTRATDLVASYDFDDTLAEGSGAFGGTANGTVRFSPEFVSFAGGLWLNGLGRFASVPHAAALVPAEITVEAWFQIDSSSTGLLPTLVSKDGNAPEAYSLGFLNILGTYYPTFSLTTTAGPHLLRSLIPVTPGRPTHLAGTYDGATARIYVDARQVHEQAVSGSIRSTSGPLRIGRGKGTTPAEQFVGDIYGVRIWDHAREACSIAGGLDRELVQGRGLVASYTFDGGLVDASGNGHDGTGDVIYTSDVTPRAKALRIDSQRPGYVRVPASPSLVHEEFTIEAWGRLNDPSTNSFQGIAANGFFALYLARLGSQYIPEFRVSTPTGPVYATGVPTTFDGPFHIAGSYDGATISLFLNGRWQVRLPASGPPSSNSFDLVIGVSPLGPSPSPETFEGTLSSVRLWRHARSDEDMLSTLNREIRSLPGLVGSWPLDGSLADVSGNGNGGTWVGNSPAEYGDELGVVFGADCVPSFYGTPSSSCATAPTMYASTPFELGQRFTFGCLDAPPSAPGLLLFSGPQAAPFDLNGVTVWTDVFSPFFLPYPATADATGRHQFSFTPVLDYYRTGTLTAMYVWLDTSPCGFSGLVGTNGIEWGS